MPATIIEREFTREADCCAAVAWWNYWDHEHVDVLHDTSYVDMQVLYEDRRMAVVLHTFRVPLFRFLKSQSISTMIMEDAETLRLYNVGLFAIPSLTTIRIREDRPDHCVFTMNYKFVLRGWRKLLAPLLGRLIARWNAQVWEEDLPLKLRRQKMLRHGFRDFVGMPERIADRGQAGPLEFKLPLARVPDSPVNAFRQRLEAGK
ncbi:MAG: hypothetical protein WD069_22255 [Planctomycetales bacterium]